MSKIEIVIPPQHGPFPGHIAADRVAAYAAATSDRTSSVLAGTAVPATFPVLLVFAAQQAANVDVLKAAWTGASGGVHGEHDIVVHRPLVPRRTTRHSVAA